MVKSDVLFFLENFDLANILLLGLRGIDREILEILVYLSLDSFFRVIFLEDILLNYAKTHCLKDLLFLFVVNLS